MLNKFSAEQAAEFANRQLENKLSDGQLFVLRDSELAAIINAALSQQSAPRVAGEIIDSALANNNKITRKAMAERDKAIHAMRKKFPVIEIAEMVGLSRQRVHQILNEPLDEDDSAPFAWATFDGEGSYDLRLYEDNENYRDEWLNRNGHKYAGWVIPLFPYASQPHPTGDNSYHDLPDTELPGMWEKADFEGGLEEVRGPDWKPAGDTQQEAVAWNLINPAGKVTATEQTAVKALARLNGYKPSLEAILAFEQMGWRIAPTHPPEETAVAQHVKAKAEEIIRRAICQNDDGSYSLTGVWEHPVEAIAAIPIPEPRPDALVAMAYRKAAEIVQRNANKYDEAYASVCIDEIHDLNPLDAQAALEEFCRRVIITHNDDAHVRMERVQSVVRATLNQQNGKD